MKILFVCKHNRFRSKVAEAIFNNYNKNSEISAYSAGIKPDALRPYIADNVKKVLGEIGVGVPLERFRPASPELINEADKIIIVADNVSPDEFPAEKTEIWNIPDADEGEIERIRMIVKDIEKRMKKLLPEL